MRNNIVLKSALVVLALSLVAGICLMAWAAPPVHKKFAPPSLSNCLPTQETIWWDVCAGFGGGGSGTPQDPVIVGGATAGVSIQWTILPDVDGDGDIDQDDCDAFVWPEYSGDDDPNFCKASLSGTPDCSIYNLGEGACVTITIGNLLDAECGVGLHGCGADELLPCTTYVFRAFAHAQRGIKRSDYTGNYCCTTECLPPEGFQDCTLSQGYWKNHFDAWCNDPINICGQDYSAQDLLGVLNTPGAGNPAMSFWHQLIAAELNQQCNSAEPPDCGDYDDICTLANTYPWSSFDCAPGQAGAACRQARDVARALLDPVHDCLELYNTGEGGVPHCETDEDPGDDD